MSSYFSQIQYVPDPITGERINVGIVAVDSTGAKFQFVSDWRRASVFGGGEDVGFLREFADEASNNGMNWLNLDQSGSAAVMARTLSRWHNKIQFSDPLPSVKSRDELLTELAPRLLHLEPPVLTVGATEQHRGRGRDKAISTATQSLAAAMRKRYGHAPRGILQKNVNVRGKIESHDLDICLKNGTLYGGAFAVSFQTGSPRNQQRDTDAIAFALEDLKAPRQDLAVILLPPNPSTSTYQRARNIFRELDAHTLLERQLPSWATSLVEKLPENIRAEHQAA